MLSRPKLVAALAGCSNLIQNSRLFVATLAITCTTFSGSVNAATIDFKISDLSEVSRGPGGYVTELAPGVGVSQNWGVGVMNSWVDSTRDVVLPTGTPPPLYWETYTFLINASGDSWPPDVYLTIGARTDSNGITSLIIERTPSGSSLNFGAEGGTATIETSEIGVSPSGIYYDIFIDLDQSWVDFGNGNIHLSQYGEPAIASVWHFPYFMEIESGYFQEAHLVYDVRLVPEPETWAMLLAGLGIVGAVTRRRR